MRRVFCLGLVALLCFLPGLASAQLTGLPQARRDAAMQQCRQIGLMLFQYATDHVADNPFPEGKSSTEVFQKLIDGGYCSDPTIFFLPLPGKSKASSRQLKPENVCFDVTAGAGANAPDDLPLVYITGYKVTFAAGGTAVPGAKPAPDAMIVFYKNNNAKVVLPDPAAIPPGAIAGFVPADFPTGSSCQQLTPEGPVQ